MPHADLRQKFHLSQLMVTGRRGAGDTEDGFSSSFRKLVKKLEAADKIEPGLTLHGLRHTVGKLIIEAGGSTKDVQTILGHQTTEMSEEYIRDFDRQERARKTIGALEKNERQLALVKPGVKLGKGS